MIVLHFWPRTMFPAFRTKANSTKLYPDVEACDAHKLSLSDIGLHVLNNAMATIHGLMESLGRDPPDMRDTLIELVTLADAERMWAAPESSPADGSATILRPELLPLH